MSKDLHVLNLGAGVQSTTLYLMFMQGEADIDAKTGRPTKLDYAVFADTGEEPKAVYKHVRWLQSLGGPPILIRNIGSRLGDDLIGGRNSTGQRFAAIPAFTESPVVYDEFDDDDVLQMELLEAVDVYAGEGVVDAIADTKRGQTRRQCSKEYKVDVIEKTIRRELYGLAPGRRLPKSARVHQYVGISLDEAGRFERLKKRRTLGTMHAPLIDRHMTRADCVAWLEERGRVPHMVPRSACVFCPFHSDAEWVRVRSVPEDWARAVEVDEALRAAGSVANRNMDAPMYLHAQLKPLVQVEFRPLADRDAGQATMGFWRDDKFSRECLGVCGL